MQLYKPAQTHKHIINWLEREGKWEETRREDERENLDSPLLKSLSKRIGLSEAALNCMAWADPPNFYRATENRRGDIIDTAIKLGFPCGTVSQFFILIPPLWK